MIILIYLFIYFLFYRFNRVTLGSNSKMQRLSRCTTVLSALRDFDTLRYIWEKMKELNETGIPKEKNKEKRKRVNDLQKNK